MTVMDQYGNDIPEADDAARMDRAMPFTIQAVDMEGNHRTWNLIPLADITREEWDTYEWHKVAQWGKESRFYLRGKKKTPPPDDGYQYERIDTYADPEYKWARCQTPVTND